MHSNEEIKDEDNSTAGAYKLNPRYTQYETKQPASARARGSKRPSERLPFLIHH